jgi:hypothetical protein
MSGGAECWKLATPCSRPLDPFVQVSRYAAGFITSLRISQHLTTHKLNYLMTSPNINAVHIAMQA